MEALRQLLGVEEEEEVVVEVVEEEEEDTGLGTTATFSPRGAHHRARPALRLAHRHRPTADTGTAVRDTDAGKACLGSLLMWFTLQLA